MLQPHWPLPLDPQGLSQPGEIIFTPWAAPSLAWCACNAGFMYPLLLGLSESLVGASEWFQKLPAALPCGDTFVPTSLLAGFNTETLINHFTSS